MFNYYKRFYLLFLSNGPFHIFCHIFNIYYTISYIPHYTRLYFIPSFFFFCFLNIFGAFLPFMLVYVVCYIMLMFNCIIHICVILLCSLISSVHTFCKNILVYFLYQLLTFFLVILLYTFV